MATNYVSQPVKVNNGYSYAIKQNPDGSYGIDYFDNTGQPITNTVFAQATGQNINEQNSIPLNLQLSQQQATNPGNEVLGAATGPAQPSGQTYGPPSALAAAVNPYASVSPYASTGSTAAASDYGIQVFNGKSYDFNDPTQRTQYFLDRSQAAQTAADQGLATTQDQIRSALGTAADQFRQSGSALDTSQTQYNQDYKTGINSLNDNFDLGTVGRQNFYGAISPNAYQSSQGTSQEFAHNKLLEGLGGLAQQKTQADTQFDTNRSGLKSQYDQYISDQQKAEANAELYAKNYVSNEKDQVASSLGQFSPGISAPDFAKQYNLNPNDPYTPPKVDISQFTPYTTYNSLFGGAGNTPGQGSALGQTYNLSHTAADPLSQYLGKNQLSEGDINYLKKYLYGTA